MTFGEIHFQDKPGATASVTATGCDVTFKGDLKFVADLAAEIEDFGSGSPVTVDATGIRAGYVLAIPTVAFGVFSLSNINLGAQVLIPFQDAPASVRFNFAERHSPFGISVGIFGGGGFLAVTATANSLERMEGSLEFGGTFEVDVVVASGGVFAMGGVSFLRAGEDISLEGYLRCGGHLKILDLVGITLEFEVVLGYREGRRQGTGPRLSEADGRGTGPALQRVGDLHGGTHLRGLGRSEQAIRAGARRRRLGPILRGFRVSGRRDG